MARKTREPRPKKPSALKTWWSNLASEQRKAFFRAAAWVVLAGALGTAAVLSLKGLERRVTDTAAAPTMTVGVKFTDRPDWMPASLVRWLAGEVLPAGSNFHDPQLTETVHRSAMANPWIRTIHCVSKYRTNDPRLGVVEIRAEFRQPLAVVNVGNEEYYVDADGVRLPSDQVPKYIGILPATRAMPARKACFAERREIPQGAQAVAIHYLAIEGVDTVAAPPPAVGQRWNADDLREGLRLAQLMLSRRYANQISSVDVRNAGGRISKSEPHLRMYAQVGEGKPTDIRFGRFPDPNGDWEITPEQKLFNLDQYVNEHNGLLAGANRYIDLRFDWRHESID
jgi:hypothetical protein